VVEFQSFRKLYDPTESVKCKDILLLRRSLSSEEVFQQLLPQCSSPLRLYRLPKIHKQGIPLKPTVSTIGAPTYHLSKLILILLGSHIGSFLHLVKNVVDFVHTLGSLWAVPQGIMVRFIVVSLFTSVQIREAMSLLS
jgi:hypothetical protein